MGPILAQALKFILTSAGGWAVSDIYNEYMTAKQSNPDVKVSDVVTPTAKFYWVKWVLVGIAGFVLYSLFNQNKRR